MVRVPEFFLQRQSKPAGHALEDEALTMSVLHTEKVPEAGDKISSALGADEPGVEKTTQSVCEPGVAVLIYHHFDLNDRYRIGILAASIDH